MERCTFGVRLNQDCNSNYPVKSRPEKKKLNTLSKEDFELVVWRSELDVSEDDEICFHHYTVLRPMEQDDASEYVPSQAVKENLDRSASAIGISPIKKVSRRDAPSYIEKKTEQFTQSVREKLQHTLFGPSTSAGTEGQLAAERETCEKCSDLDEIINSLKLKCSVSRRSEKVKILTLVPDSWSIEKTCREFNVSRYLVRKARQLKKTGGILADPGKKKGHGIPEEVKKRVLEFYENDQYSRLCPGQKDYKSVTREDGTKEQKQKRLLLCNLSELYTEYKKVYPNDKIGQSAFCDLRPKWCITTGSRGTHSVCVCEIHQNVKLMIASLPWKTDHSELMSKMVCDTTKRACMLHCCSECPGKATLQHHLEEQFSACDMDEEDDIVFKRWEHTDRTTLLTMQMKVSDFIETLSNGIQGLCPHHFISKAQSAYLNDQKSTLQDDEAIILLDFAENYSFVVQDAVQGYHWDNSQVTLHPFVVYGKANGELKMKSFCVFSDSLEHSTNAVHAFTGAVLEKVKEVIPGLKKVHYFSDGAGSQYKNYKNLSNLCHHQQDFGIQAEWNFFATSHGKSPCDGVGGTTKRMILLASLRAPVSDQITTPQGAFNCALQSAPGISHLFVSSADIKTNQVHYDLEERYQSVKRAPGIRSHHSFKPLSAESLEMRRVSGDAIFSTIRYGATGKSERMDELERSFSQYEPGQYLACVYDDQWYIGNILKRDEEQKDVEVQFMQRSGKKTLPGQGLVKSAGCLSNI